MRGLVRTFLQKRVVAQYLAHNEGFKFRGFPIAVPSDLHIGIQAQIVRGDYEASECALIERYLQPDLPVIELGGCLGLVSAVVARKLTAETPMIVVEANPTLLETCRKNATLLGVRTATEVVSKAVAYNGTHVSFDARHNVHISKLGDGRQPDAIQVEATTLAALTAQMGWPESFTLICDIEGAEVDLFKNDIDALQRCALAIVELHPLVYQASGYGVDHVVDLAAAAGFKVLAQDKNVFAFARAVKAQMH